VGASLAVHNNRAELVEKGLASVPVPSQLRTTGSARLGRQTRRGNPNLVQIRLGVEGDDHGGDEGREGVSIWAR